MAACAAPAASASARCPGDDAVPTDATRAEAAWAIVCDVNAIRADRGLPPLRWDWRLWWVAHNRTAQMAAAQQFSHSPDLADRAAAAGYPLEGGMVLENLGWGAGAPATPIAISLGWLHSDRHRLNLLDPDVRDIGIGMAAGRHSADGQTGMFYAAEFGARGEEARAADRPVRARCARTGRRQRARAFVRGRVHRGHCRRARS